jgi:lysozyme
MSDEGVAHLKSVEGCRLTAYKDTVGVWTIGYGHSERAGLPPVPVKGLTITDEAAEDILRLDLQKFERAVAQAVEVPVTQKQFDALVSFAFNIGVQGFRRSTVVKRLNQGDHLSAAEAMLMWNKPPEIIGRRQKEYAMFKSGIEIA